MKTAVFSTSDVQRWHPGDYSVHLEEPESTGVIEAALAAGYTIYVASTRMRPSATDRWWVALVGEDNVFFANDHGDYRTMAESPDPNREIGSGWARLYERLGEDWPTWEGEPEFWAAARAALAERGYAQARDFPPNPTTKRR